MLNPAKKGPFRREPHTHAAENCFGEDFFIIFLLFEKYKGGGKREDGSSFLDHSSLSFFLYDVEDAGETDIA